MNREEHLLTIVMEEAAEVAKAAAKALRFGLGNISPEGRTNAEAIVEEMIDLKAVMQMLQYGGSLPLAQNMPRKLVAKTQKIEKFLLVSKEKGRLT